VRPTSNLANLGFKCPNVSDSVATVSRSQELFEGSRKIEMTRNNIGGRKPIVTGAQRPDLTT
jgi:hypothetical protein